MVFWPTSQSYYNHLYVSLVARCLSVITSFNPTSKGFLKMVTSFLTWWCMHSSIRSKTAEISQQNSSNLSVYLVDQEVVNASFTFSLKDPGQGLWLSSSAGWWCDFGGSAGCMTDPGFGCVFFCLHIRIKITIVNLLRNNGVLKLLKPLLCRAGIFTVINDEL